MPTNTKQRQHRFAKQRQHIQEFIRELKAATPCTDCHKRHPYYVMEFDHLKALGKKVANISDLARNCTDLRKIFLELSKCEIVCSNCHKKRTYHRSKGHQDAI